uniref:Uncharacterized protein n=1 Tax=Cacopsylla melanoneura TaxID=428564 RepID=A0A8D8VRQ0_9HEMI
MCLFTHKTLCLLMLGVQASFFSLATCKAAWNDIDLNTTGNLWPHLNVKQFIGKDLCIPTNNQTLCIETFRNEIINHYFDGDTPLRAACDADYEDLGGVVVCWLRHKAISGHVVPTKKTITEVQFWTDSKNVSHMRDRNP